MIFPTHLKVYEVGGFVRDKFMGYSSKDIDFAVEGPKNLAGLQVELENLGFEVFKVDEPTFTVRARFPRTKASSTSVSLRAMKPIYDGLAADFVLCRREGPYSDGRHPDWVEVGDIADDLARRDFTVNAIARKVLADGSYETLDPHDGMADIEARRLQFVGDPMHRIREDALRVVRGLRFIVTKDLSPTAETWDAMISQETSELLASNISIERVRDELHRMFQFHTLLSLSLLDALPSWTYDAIMRDGLWLEPTLKSK